MFSYDLEYTREDGSTGGMTGGDETLTDTLTNAAKSISYYLGLGYKIGPVQLRQFCPECKGNGTLPSSRKRIRKTCKACKGTGHKLVFPA